MGCCYVKGKPQRLYRDVKVSDTYEVCHSEGRITVDTDIEVPLKGVTDAQHWEEEQRLSINLSFRLDALRRQGVRVPNPEFHVHRRAFEGGKIEDAIHVHVTAEAKSMSEAAKAVRAVQGAVSSRSLRRMLRTE
jgi:hypothetical protein